MELRFSGDRPVVQELTEAVEAEIAAGRLRAGDRLLPAVELAAAAGVSRNAMERALTALAAQGLLRREGETYLAAAEPKAVGRALALRETARYLGRMAALGYGRGDIPALMEEVEQ